MKLHNVKLIKKFQFSFYIIPTVPFACGAILMGCMFPARIWTGSAHTKRVKTKTAMSNRIFKTIGKVNVDNTPTPGPQIVK